VHAISLAFGLNTNEGLLGQYWSYLDQLFHGNLGVSVTYFPSTVGSVLRTALPWTVALVGVATVLSFVFGTLLGILSAWRRGSRTVDSLLPITAFLSAVPYFWLGLVVLTLFAVEVRWLPIAGGFSVDVTPGWSWAFISSAVDHAILPALTIVVSSIAGWLLGMRNMMISTLAEDYVLLAEAKGLHRRRVLYTYAARNAILPNVASFALSLGFIVGGAILTEIVFSYPGIGYVLFQAVSNNDYPLMQGVFLIITFMVLLANLLADVCYVLLDPRTRESDRR
jgi:peptide/nickel transport system permease protein